MHPVSRLVGVTADKRFNDRAMLFVSLNHSLRKLLGHTKDDTLNLVTQLLHHARDLVVAGEIAKQL